MTTSETFIPTSDGTNQVIGRLIDMSYAKPLDLEGFLQWDLGVDRSRPPKPESHSWIYGTRHWDALSEAERLETLWQENARDISMFIYLEQYIPPLYVGYINQHRDKIPKNVMEYLMIFSKEEIVHTLAFRRYMKIAGLELFTPPQGYARLFDRLPHEHPVVGILYTLLIEWLAELGAMHNARDRDIDPVTKDLYLIHHQDEARHIGFARKLVECFFEVTPTEILNQIRTTIRAQLPSLFGLYTYNPEIASRVSFAFPVAPEAEEEIALIRTSENNRRLNEERFGELYAWLTKLEIMGQTH